MDATSGLIGVIKLIFKPIIDFLEKIFFYSAYDFSTTFHKCREAFGTPPDELIDGLEFKVIWKPYYLGKKLTNPAIWLKTNNNQKYSKITITVSAYNNKIKYQDYLTLFDIDEKFTQSSLPSIPFRDSEIKGSSIYTPYDYIETRIHELHDASGNPVKIGSKSARKVRCPFDRIPVILGKEKDYVEKWGKIFNLQFIETCITDYQIELMSSNRNRPVIYNRLKRSIFTARWIVKLLFWSKNLFFARTIRKEFDKQIINYLPIETEHPK